VRRREFITLLGTAAAEWPLAARAQQAATPVVGFLSSASSGPYAPFVSAFHKGLNEASYAEGRNVHIAFRWAEGRYDRLSALAAELVDIQVAVILAAGGTQTGIAAKTATSTIPIVNVGSDPDRVGLVASSTGRAGTSPGMRPDVLVGNSTPAAAALLAAFLPTETGLRS
jgi:putative ABC transport system substrate-binding protein